MKNKARKIRQVTLLPGWFMRLKGRLDAKHGLSVVKAYINRLLKRLASLESREALVVEKQLCLTRDSAAVCIENIGRSKNAIAKAPSDMPATSDIAVRANRRNAARIEANRSAIDSSMRVIISSNETLIDELTNLEERIKTMRAKCGEKVMQYVLGVRKRISDFAYDFTVDDNTAVELYVDQHKELDDEIRRIAYNWDYDSKEE